MYQNFTCEQSKNCSRIKSLLLLLIVPLLFISTQTFGQAANLDQIRNGPANDPTKNFYSTFPNPEYINGNAGASNAHYVEGMSISYRSLLTGLTATRTYEYIIEYDTKHSAAMALDYLTSYQRLQPHSPFGHAAEVLNPRIFKDGSREYLIGLIATEPIKTFLIPRPLQANSPVAGMPQDSYDDLPVAERQMTIINGTITNISYVQEQSLTTSASEAKTSVKIRFTAGKDSVVLAWGGHIASRLDWGYTNPPTNTIPRSAGGISGSPYHMRHLSMAKVLPTPVQNISLGNQDRSLSAAAVVAPPECPNVASATQCLEAGSFTFTITTPDAGTVYTWSFGSNTVGATFSGGGATATGTSVTVTHSTTDNASNNGGAFSLNISAVKNSITEVCTGVATGTVVDVDVAAFVNGNATSSGSPATLNTNQANPTAALTAVIGSEPATLTWAPVAGSNATVGNLSATTGAAVTFTPTAAANPPGGFIAGLYVFEVTATSTVRNVCLATARVYIDASGNAGCPGISGPAIACATPQGNGLTYTAGLASPGANLTYVWSIAAPANGASIVGTSEGVPSITVNAGTGDFTVVLKIRADNGQIFEPAGCTYPVDVVAIPTVSAVYNPPACDQDVFTVDVTTEAGNTIVVTQPGNPTNPNITAGTPSGGVTRYSGLTAGDGFIVTVTSATGGCTASTNCAGSTNSCATGNRAAPATTETTEQVAEKPLVVGSPGTELEFAL